MNRRTKIGIAGLASVAVLASIAALWWLWPSGEKSKPGAEEASGYGTFIPVAEATGESSEDCPARRAADQSGMSGAEARLHVHGNLSGTMWCVAPEAGESASLVFDLGRVEPLGEMWIWNYNEHDNNSSNGSLTERGLRDVSVFLSTDGHTWDEWKGDGYPYRFAKADGSERLRATNLDDGENGPVRFAGTPARYVKLTAAEKAGKGNWSTREERVFGLSEVRFYRYAGAVVYGGRIDPAGARDSSGNEAESRPENVVNRYGMAGDYGKDGVHGNDARAMWLARGTEGGPPALTVDLGGTYPLGEMWVWNYNAAEDGGTAAAASGIRDVGIYYSLDAKEWTELQGDGHPYRFAQADGAERLAATNLEGGGPVEFGGATARYVKLVPQGGAGEGNWGAEQAGQALYGLSELRFFSGAGLAVEPEPEWTGLFSRYEGWTGADGIFSIPVDGADQPGSADDASRTVFLFSDTYAGQVNPVTRARDSGAIVNNSVAMLEGAMPDPEAIRFEWVPKSADISMFAPHTPLSETMPGSWYWLQDGIVRDGRLILFPLLMVKDPAQPPGFQFATRGVSRISVPMTEDGPDYAAQTQEDTPLFKKLPDGGEIAFGAGIMDNSAEAGAPDPDGYIYVYGYKIDPEGVKRLIVARVLPEAIGDDGEWRFWDGRDWTERIEDSAELLDGVSPELSVTPISSGRWAGKYLLICEKDSISGYVAYSVGESPAGPFGPMTPIYYTTELDEGQDIVTYNAKAHPHLSRPGELLVTYNVNSTSLAANANNADIYRPHWLRIRELGPSS
ncbi:discoidin domain-containing protein [Paenibacillaceae bacterium WGS1546]|uniref:discoidin domain-containing protein n=1 Tax=Cohnella sp. WGS1546 TaxID=3366810 RepID=UPI00372CF8E1